MDIKKSLDNSALKTYQTCPRLFYYTHELGLVEPMGINARFSDRLIHLPLTAWYEHGPKWQPPWSKLWDSFEFTPEEKRIKAVMERCSLDNAKSVFKFYTERYVDDFKRFKILGSEDYIIDESIGFGSKPDVRAQEIATNDLYTIELKFSEWDYVTVGACMNTQFLGQVNNTKGHGCLVAQIMPVDDKWTRYNCFRQEIVPRPPDMEEWRKETAARINQVKESRKLNVWAKNVPEGCTRYNKECHFIRLCEAGVPKKMIDRMEKRDPFEYLQKGKL